MASKPKARSFHYEKRSREDVKARANMRGGGFDSFIKPDFKRFKLKDGKNVVRILPATWEKPKHYGYDIWLNYGIGADNQTYLSLSKMEHEDGDNDPLVEARREAQRENDEKTAKALQPRQRVLVWVIDRQEEEAGPQLWDIPFSVDKDFVNLCLDEDTKEVMYPDDPDEGHDLRFYKEGQGVGTKYPASRMKLLDASPLHEDADTQQEWLDYIKENPVPDCLQYYSAEEISAAFNGQVATRDDDDEDRPRRSRSRDDDEDDNEEAEEKPRSKRSRDEDEEPDAEEEKPRQSIRERLAARRKTLKDEDDE